MCTNVNPAPHSTPALIQQRSTHSTGMELIQNMLTGSTRHLHQEHFFISVGYLIAAVAIWSNFAFFCCDPNLSN